MVYQGWHFVQLIAKMQITVFPLAVEGGRRMSRSTLVFRSRFNGIRHPEMAIH
jgi:hypothetical protein